MTPVAERIDNTKETYDEKTAMHILLSKLDEAIDDMKQGRVQSLDEAWEEIDVIQLENIVVDKSLKDCDCPQGVAGCTGLEVHNKQMAAR